MTKEQIYNRRSFLKISAGAGASFVLGLYLTGCQNNTEATAPITSNGSPTPTVLPTPTEKELSLPKGVFEPGLFVKIDPDNSVTITVVRSEMGQGVRTALPMIVAEELDADWDKVQVVQAPTDRIYGDQGTGGSRSISTLWSQLRVAGATARAMLMQAAAQVWEVEISELTTGQSFVIHQATNRHLSYGALAGTAAQLEIPENAKDYIKDPKDFNIIGQDKKPPHLSQIVTGQALYGLDYHVPGMRYAVIARCPVFGGKLISFDATEAKKVSGVSDVVEVKSGIAVVADNTWAAIKGREALEVVWDEKDTSEQSSDAILENFKNQFAEKEPADDNTLEAYYTVPLLAHATMEPMNCLADVQADSCEIWAPTQNPQPGITLAQGVAKIPAGEVKFNVTLMGGGFGRRWENDYVQEAAEVSKAVNAPVKVVWTREDDIQHDFYHPLSYTQVRAKLEPDARISTSSREIGRQAPTGFWRSVDSFTDAFVQESFLDELAHALGRDPYQFRLERKSNKLLTVLKLAAEKAEWDKPLPAGWGRGIASETTWGTSPTAQVAEVSVAENGAVTVHRIVCAIDCGMVINPDIVKAQIEGGIIFALTAALKSSVTLKAGRIQESNFHDHPLLRIDETPKIEVYIVPSEEPPQGVGEMGGPPVAPAVANAIFNATGKRVRQIPFLPETVFNA